MAHAAEPSSKVMDGIYTIALFSGELSSMW